MNKVLIGALVLVGVAAVAYYLSDPDRANEQLGDLKDKASDAFDKAKNTLNREADRNRETGRI